MLHTHFSVKAALIALLVFQVFCKENQLESVENRNPEGQIERYQRRKNNLAKEGLYQRFAPGGQLLEEAHYINDTLEGERRYFFPDGKVESIEHFSRGKFHGKYQKFYKSGQLYIEQEFVEGAMQGLSISYYPNGLVKERVTIRDNDENGPFQEYWENGKLHFEGAYQPTEDGSAEQGELKEYNENGELIRIADCNQGVCLTRWRK